MDQKTVGKAVEFFLDNHGIGHITLNRPNRGNSINADVWKTIPQLIHRLDPSTCRCLLLTANGPNFCSGLDLSIFKQFIQEAKTTNTCPSRARYHFKSTIEDLQAIATAFDRSPIPVIVAVHGACIGGGVDIITGCDIRLCSKDATFSVREVDLGIVADLGSLQRLPFIIGYGKTMELALTGTTITAQQALDAHLVSGVYDSREELIQKAEEMARSIAQKSPLAVTGTKRVLQFQRNNNLSVEGGLDYVRTWNSGMLYGSEDLEKALEGMMKREQPVFSKL